MICSQPSLLCWSQLFKRGRPAAAAAAAAATAVVLSVVSPRSIGTPVTVFADSCTDDFNSRVIVRTAVSVDFIFRTAVRTAVRTVVRFDVNLDILFGELRESLFRLPLLLALQEVNGIGIKRSSKPWVSGDLCSVMLIFHQTAAIRIESARG